MKISIVTICLNSQETIQETFNSVLCQNYKNIEHIIIDGGSTDATKLLINEYPFKNKKVYFKKNIGLYKSLNLGIKKCTGKFILILHSDDILNNPNIITKLVKNAKKSRSEIILGSVVYYNYYKDKIQRYFPSLHFEKKNLLKGLIAPHTGMFIKRSLQIKFKYDESFKIAGDFDFFLRCLLKEQTRFTKINLLLTRMKSGGVSGKNLYTYITSSKEIIRSLNKNKFNFSAFLIYFRFLYKIKQLIFINTKKINKFFIYKINKFYKDKLNTDFVICKNLDKLFQKKKFILSAMNLAFLGSYVSNKTLKFPYIYHWPDGISAKLIKSNLKKIPGKKILENIRNYKFIKRIIVIGNLSKNSKQVLFVKFNKKIINYKVPYADHLQIFKSLNYKPKSSDLIFLTLPTPKQELVAIEIAKKYLNYKIICIGGSVAIYSGEEKEVPPFLSNFEFVWRLQYETLRRIKRLFSTAYNVLTDYLWSRKIAKLNVKIE